MLLFLAQAFLANSLFSTCCAPDTAMVLSKHLQASRSLANLKAGSLGRAYLPNDARAKVFHGLGPGSSVTEAVLETVLKELDSFLVVDDYGSVECVKFARDEYNKRRLRDNLPLPTILYCLNMVTTPPTTWLMIDEFNFVTMFPPVVGYI